MHKNAFEANEFLMLLMMLHLPLSVNILMTLKSLIHKVKCHIFTTQFVSLMTCGHHCNVCEDIVNNFTFTPAFIHLIHVTYFCVCDEEAKYLDINHRECLHTLSCHSSDDNDSDDKKCFRDEKIQFS